MWMPSICTTMMSRPDRSAPIHSFMRAADNATKCREAADFDTPAPAGAGTSPSGSRTARRNFRVDTFDQHQVHRPLAEPVLRDRTLPARQRQFLAPEVAHAGPLNCHPAGVEADLALGSAPAMTAPAIAAGMANPASLLGVLFHHGSERIDPAVRQNLSKLTETASQALSTAPSPVGGKAVNGVIAFFMALLSFRGISTPSLPAQGEQRRSS